MRSQIFIVYPGRRSLETILRQTVSDTGAKSLGLAVAYVSVYGTKFIKTLIRDTAVRQVKLIADIRDGISHPQALRMALDESWQVRAANRRDGTFHPKVFIAGDKFAADGTPIGVRMYLIGSSNLTNGGLNRNIECNMVKTSNDPIPIASAAFKTLWSLGADLDDTSLKRYEHFFAERNRNRSLDDLLTLGVADTPDEIDAGAAPERTRRAADPTISTRAATVAWAGLQSSTGEYRFQVEFPRSAGEVLGRIIGAGSGSANVSVLCDDGIVRQMTYRFYHDNSMFRLNVPNDVPGVEEARRNHSGVAYVERIENPSARVRLSIYHNLSVINKIVRRSIALGTLGQTSTRLYGWY